MTKIETKPDAVAAAEQSLATARSAVEREQGRLKQTEAQIAALTAQISQADPDDVAGLGKLVAARDAARGRGEALATRVGAAEAAVEAAEEKLAEAKSDAAAAETARLEAEIVEVDRACTAEAQAGEERLLALVRRVRELVKERREIEIIRRTKTGDSGSGMPVRALTYNADWGDVPDNHVGSRALVDMREYKAHLRAHGSMLVGS